MARLVIPGVPHHVTQRGNRRETVFFDEGDYRFYLTLLREAAQKSGTLVWSYCLMPNHVHLILEPQKPDGLRAFLGDAHRRYTRFINARNNWTGHLWQGRYGSVAMDDRHCLNALRYVALNPVRAGLVDRAEAWRWSSVRAHLNGKSDGIAVIEPVRDRIPDFAAMLNLPAEDAEAFAGLRKSETSGRPLGSAEWLAAHQQ